MIHVVARTQETGSLFLENHFSLRARLIFEHGQKSYFSLLNKIINDSPDEYACIVHDDVLLCHDFNHKIDSLLEILNRDWPNWGVAGNAGVATCKFGYSASQTVRYLSDPQGGPNLVGHILPAMHIDGNVMLLNIKELRERSVNLPAFEGFHLYNIILSIEAICAGLGVLVAPQLACWHGSAGNQKEFDLASTSSAFQVYISKRIKNRYLKTINGNIQIHLTGSIYKPHIGIDLEIEGLRTACNNRREKKVAIVTRTTFNRPELLDRCLRSISSLIAQSGSLIEFKSYIVTNYDKPNNIEVPSSVEILMAPYSTDVDSRFLLVRFAADHIDADHFWFIDDDDWVFPNEAERLSLTINSSPLNSVFFVDCERYKETQISSGNTTKVELFKSKAEIYFSSEKFLYSLSGYNNSPFCGVIYSRNALLSLPDKAVEAVTYLEDFYTTLHTLLACESIPVVINKLLVGISVRETGNTITEQDRTKWNSSMSELVSSIVNNSTLSQMLSLPLGAIHNKYSEADVAHIKAQHEADLARINMIISSRSWRMTLPLRNIAWLIRKIRSRLNSYFSA
ncbi:glycosyltransferase family A protein [Acidithiobacillus montserratensis]|uniref:Glycosyltransferase family A protein n=1 Tax=Acidithiobacillus montserratensis TaxID=2729135 RepID=A0ACD5HE08_9PROT|nr:glycosyltransferase family A protein [Acidithiobacillus montserratensis]MBN2678809.1 glycosyltransferase family 2 protein [Acidithiobacillaceae bacterium]MBU2748830.1 glycosyltransferase family 2 protein [Acidithiobacillus montserratensis]